VNLIEKANSNFNVSTASGTFLFNLFPSLLKFPEWLPGMQFKAIAREWRKDMERMAEAPYDCTVEKMVRNSNSKE